MLFSLNRHVFKPQWPEKAALVYLVVPFVIFCLTFLKFSLGLAVIAVLGWAAWNALRCGGQRAPAPFCKLREWLPGLLIVGFWVLLSGVGGLAFQNSDHHFRNAVFHDLVAYDFPAYYTAGTHAPAALVYYIGFWLPAALIGKAAGWQAANLALFVWVWLGVFLTAAMLKRQMHASLPAVVLFLALFSGMDIVGTLIIELANPASVYPTVLPPITHLEWWAHNNQFSAFTTQLFWVFNQAVPAWICMALLLNTSNPRYIFFIWSFCLFLAPIPAVGMLPFVLLMIPRRSFDPSHLSFSWKKGSVKAFLKNIWLDFVQVLSVENMLGGGFVAVISALYYSTNSNSSMIHLLPLDLITGIIFLVFALIEFFLLWTIFFREQKRSLWWYVVGGILLLAPVIVVGRSLDFCMRASIPALWMLMAWSGEAFFRRPKVKYWPALCFLLVIGSFTSLYEINRSIYRTVTLYMETGLQAQAGGYSPTLNLADLPPEIDHPNSIAADQYQTVVALPDAYIMNYLGSTKESVFFEHMAPSPEQSSLAGLIFAISDDGSTAAQQ